MYLNQNRYRNVQCELRVLHSISANGRFNNFVNIFH